MYQKSDKNMESDNFITSIPIKRSKERKRAEKEIFTRISFQIFDWTVIQFRIQTLYKMDLNGIYLKIHLHKEKHCSKLLMKALQNQAIEQNFGFPLGFDTNI